MAANGGPERLGRPLSRRPPRRQNLRPGRQPPHRSRRTHGPRHHKGRPPVNGRPLRPIARLNSPELTPPPPRIPTNMLFKEIRQAIRLLLNNPGFTAIAALSLALGIGANSAIFSLADAILLRPLPIPQPIHVLNLRTAPPSTPLDGVSFPEYRDIRDKNQSLAGLVAFQFTTVGFAATAKALPQMRMGQIG